jgi:hypothetical protein
MIISDLNPVQFWTVPDTALTDVIDLVSFGVTFNTKDKNYAVAEKIYFHILKSDDLLTIEIIVDESADTHIISGRNQDGTLWQDFDFVQITGRHFRLAMDLSLYPAAADTKKFFAIVDTTTNMIKAVSDHHSIKSSIRESTLVITYSHNATWNYVLADVDMKLRIPARFFREVYPEEVETIDLSDGSIAGLSGSVKIQRQMDNKLSALPAYKIRTLKYALKCKNVLIDGVYWKQETPLEQTPIDDDSEFEKFKVVLTQQGSIIRNVYAN